MKIRPVIPQPLPERSYRCAKQPGQIQSALVAVYDALHHFATPIRGPVIRGTWQVIQFQPDFATGERFNIGVVFFERRKSTLHARILPSLSGLRALYGSASADNFNFLLGLLRESMFEHGQAVSPGPQITFSKKKFAAGNTPQEIVDSLYSAMVALSRVKNDSADEALSGLPPHDPERT